ncbi:zf-C2HC5-domain-containing protein [Choiromyces venosus 120613-1]|uniref:Zf-C2HC5-domain-containing protein n=1 Tax=Choiromyces venosus 120613-1 TaxID=1336337 RepID=A0A3N4JU00_9PEZI|nr:zf-C2HC5-domain-containing protein [Choiromyces venosus 120613-1]
MKKDIEDEYYTGGSRVSTAKPVESSSPSSSVPVSRTATPIPRSSTPQLVQQKTQQSSSNVGGKLTSDLINVKAKVKKAPQKIHVTGGVAMRGASAELTDLESALRALELSTNPTLTSKSQKCNCAGMKHEVLSAAPNCLSCGKIICIKEGLAPCSFCNTPLIAPDELQSMIRELREESGRERMAMNNAMQKRPDVARVPKPFSNHDSTPGTNDDEGLRKATEHRDRLLVFQATSAQRTKIIDQAADFETPVMGSNMWATPQERALQLKKQQKAMREMEWNAKEDYEKRRVVVAVDLKGRQVVRKMQEIERPREGSDEGDVEEEAYDDTLERGGATATNSTSKGGTYSRNPLLKGMIRPVYDSGKGKGKEGGEGEEGKKVDTEAEGYTGGSRGWRRVQDDFADNEEVILDGSMSAEGSGEKERGTQGEEPACG